MINVLNLIALIAVLSCYGDVKAVEKLQDFILVRNVILKVPRWHKFYSCTQCNFEGP